MYHFIRKQKGDCTTGCQGSPMRMPLRSLSDTSPGAVGISSMLADIKIAACYAAFLTALEIFDVAKIRKIFLNLQNSYNIL
jgi:hypothetical protein